MSTRTGFVVSAVVISMLAIPAAHAGFFGDALGGAILGDLVGGRDGAAVGAVIGGVVGASRHNKRRKQEQQRQAQMQQRKAEWAARQQAEQEHYRQEQAVAAKANDASQVLVTETQKSLIRLGYEPGPIGQSGSQLNQAVIEYQKSKDLLETGELSEALLTHMLRNGG